MTPRRTIKIHAIDPLEQLVNNGWKPDPEQMQAVGINEYHVCFMRRVGKKNLTSEQIAKRVRQGKSVKPTGGATEVMLNAYPSVMFGVTLGEARCSDDDTFNRRFGERLALARAIRAAAEQYEKRAHALRALLTVTL